MHTPSSHPRFSSHLANTRVLYDINNKISELLESQEFLQQDQSFQDLLTRLEEALDTKVKEAGYDFKDYSQRLFWSQEELEAILEQDQELKGLYEELLQAIEFAPHLRQALWDKLLFDGLLELGSSPEMGTDPITLTFQQLKEINEIPPSLGIYDLPTDATPEELEEVFLKIEKNSCTQEISLSFNHFGAFGQKQLQAIFSHLGYVRSVDLGWNSIGNLDIPSLQAIFSHLRNVRSINLKENDLGTLDEQRLHTIFSHLGKVRSIHLGDNDLYKLDVPSLQAIFSFMGNVRSIDLGDNDLHKLDVPSLQAIFSHLGNVRSIDLGMNNLGALDVHRLQAIFSHLGAVRSNLSANDLWKLDFQRLQAIFSYMGNVKTIDLSYNNLGQLDEPRLQTIFSHLRNVRSIDLRQNDLWNLDVPSLRAIFSHLTQIEVLFLDSPEDARMIKSFFPHLAGKIKIQ